MAGELVGSLSSVRIQAYEADVVARSGRELAEVSRGEVESLYIWQVSVAAAWYETIALFEPLMRNRIDVALRDGTQRTVRLWIGWRMRPRRYAVLSDGQQAAAELKRKKRQDGVRPFIPAIELR